VPLIVRENGFRFHFYSFEGNPLEPAHVHVAKAGADAKFWLEPDVSVSYDRGLSPAELRWALEFATVHRDEFIDAWKAFFARTDQGRV
jgi:Domain of unknown function (DUF4160)